MSAHGYCTDCESWTELHDNRCGCGSGRMIVPPAGYRIVGPGEMDAETLEKAAQEMECRAQWALDEAKKIMDEWVTVEGISAEDKADNRQEARRYREMSPVYRSAASVFRSLAKGGSDG